jgi:hypothetical protein
MSGHRILGDLFDGLFEVPDPGDGNHIALDRDMMAVPLASVGAETRTFDAPVKPGLLAFLSCRSYGGNIVLTVTGTYDGANSAITFTAVGQWVMLLAVCTAANTYRWRIVKSNIPLSAGAAQASTGAMTTVGANTGTAGAGLSLIGNTSTGDQSGAVMNDLAALREDNVANNTLLEAIRTALVDAKIIKGAA